MQRVKKLKMWQKVLFCLVAGIVFGMFLSKKGGVEVAWIASISEFCSFLGNIYIRLIKMIVVPLVLCSIVSAIAELKDLKKLKSIGIKTILIFSFTSMIAITLGVILAYLMKPGAGIKLSTVTDSITITETGSFYQTVLDMIPTNIFESLTSGNMLQIIVFSVFLGVAIIRMGKKGERIHHVFKTGCDIIYQIVDLLLLYTPIAVFGLMTNAMAINGVEILGSIAKFVFTDYLASMCQVAFVYIPMLLFVAKVNPFLFLKAAFESWLVGFSTCASMAVLPVSMKNATKKMGIPKETADFVLPFGATANMDGSGIFFGLIVVFAAQIVGIDLTTGQLISLILQATLLSIGCAAVPQVGLVIATTMITSMGLPLEVIGLVTGIYRILDQIHTATNVTGDLVVAACVSASEGILDRSVCGKETLEAIIEEN